MGMLRNMLEERHTEGDWQVDSAGTWGLEGDPAAAGSRAVMENVGIDISDHKARRVDYELLKSSDLVLTMETRPQRSLVHGVSRIFRAHLHAK